MGLFFVKAKGIYYGNEQTMSRAANERAYPTPSPGQDVYNNSIAPVRRIINLPVSLDRASCRGAKCCLLFL